MFTIHLTETEVIYSYYNEIIENQSYKPTNLKRLEQHRSVTGFILFNSERMQYSVWSGYNGIQTV